MIQDIRSRIKRHEPFQLGGEHLARPEAAVLMPIVDHPDGPAILLTERAGSLSSHAGEVAFPGGKVDDTDESTAHAALRENEEELGIAPLDIEMLGPMRPFISKFGLKVTPFVGVVAPTIICQPNPDEIASVFEVPLQFFLEASPFRIDELDRHGEFHRVPAFRFDDYEIWGLTAMILMEFIDVMELTPQGLLPQGFQPGKSLR